MKTLTVKTYQREELVDITPQINKTVAESGIKNGTCLIYVPHTTAGTTINENADPAVKADILTAMRQIVPDSLPYNHGEGNSPAHVKASLMGSSIQIIIENGGLRLGTWQGIYFCEFDGPRTRSVWVTCG